MEKEFYYKTIIYILVKLSYLFKLKKKSNTRTIPVVYLKNKIFNLWKSLSTS